MSTEQAILSRYINQHSKRYKHSFKVAEIARELSLKHHYKSPEKAYTAGLLHDIAKEFSLQQLLDKCLIYETQPDKFERESSSLLHGLVGSLILKHEHQLTDNQLLNAIRYHTTGRSAMNALEKIVFIADIVSTKRNLPHARDIYSVAQQDLDYAVWLKAKYTLQWLSDKDQLIHPRTLAVYNHFCFKTTRPE